MASSYFVTPREAAEAYDREACRRICVSYGRWRSASEALQALPESERLVVGDRPQPLLKIIRDSADQMQRLGAAFGLSGPASRQRLAGAIKQAPGKFDGFIGGDEPA